MKSKSAKINSLILDGNLSSGETFSDREDCDGTSAAVKVKNTLDNEPALPSKEFTEGKDRRLRLRAALKVSEKYRGSKINRDQWEKSTALESTKDIAGNDSDIDITEDSSSLGELPEISDNDSNVASEFRDDEEDLTGPDFLSIPRSMERELSAVEGPQSGLDLLPVSSEEDKRARVEAAAHCEGALDIWGKLMDIRISLQPAVLAANKLELGGDPSDELDSAREVARDLCASLVQLQSLVADRVKPLKRKREGEEEDCWAALFEERNKSVREYCLEEADRWKARSQVQVSRSFKSLDQSFTAQMEFLMSDPEDRWVKKCMSAESVYDDAPFYVSLLKEVVSSAGGVGGSGSFADFKRMQGLRSAMQSKKKVERSKARKGIKYVTIEKLANFMAPQPLDGELVEAEMVEPIMNSIFQSWA